MNTKSKQRAIVLKLIKEKLKPRLLAHWLEIERHPKEGRGCRWRIISWLRYFSLMDDMFPLNHPQVVKAINDAISENDWKFMEALVRLWRYKKTLTVDDLSVFLIDNCDRLNGLTDREIATKAKESLGRKYEAWVVRDRRGQLGLVFQKPRITKKVKVKPSTRSG